MAVSIQLIDSKESGPIFKLLSKEAFTGLSNEIEGLRQPAQQQLQNSNLEMRIEARIAINNEEQVNIEENVQNQERGNKLEKEK